jgi:hypothetical protein
LSVRHRIGKPSVGSKQWNAHGTAAQAFFSRSAAGSATSYNEHGVQIMTPAYEGDRATPKIVLKNRWFAPPATPSAPSPSPDAGKRSRLRVSFLWTICLLLLIATTTGCPHIVSMEYQPTNSLKGQGPVGTRPFRYQPSEEQHVRPRQVQTDPSSKNKLYLTKEIGVFFEDALRKELDRSGYRTMEPGDRIVSGTITRFHLDWKSGQERSFELAVDYTVRSGERTRFTWHCTSAQRGPNLLVQDGMLIREGIADCVHRFLAAAQEANAF